MRRLIPTVSSRRRQNHLLRSVYLYRRAGCLLLGELASVDLARAPEAGLHLHRLAPVAEDTGRAGGDGEGSEDADIEATEKVLAKDLVGQCAQVKLTEQRRRKSRTSQR
jgi:hypothetical protein